MATRFHAYHLNGKEFAMSYAFGNEFLLVGAHYQEPFIKHLKRELKIMNVTTISCLFIPEWSEEYCGDGTDLRSLLNDLCPTHIIIPHWESQKQLVARCKSHIEQYQKDKPYADVQFLYDEDKDQPSVSNNNVTFLGVNHQSGGHIVAHRFESGGIWVTIDLNGNTYSENVLKSDIVVCPSLNKDEAQRMIDASKCLKANINIVYTEIDMGLSLLDKLRRTGICYDVKNSDVVVMREDTGRAVVYNMDSDQRDLINKKEYTPY